MTKQKIEYLKIDDLAPYARNTRTHSPEQVEQIAASITEFGFTNPVLIDGEGGIIAGHGRVMAARTLGMDELPCVRLSDMPKSYLRNGVKDALCQDCGTEYSVRKDTSPVTCRRCASARGGKSMLGNHRTERASCRACGQTFRASLGYTYCSIACRKKENRISRTCKQCSEEFYIFKSSLKTNASGNFCSRKCYEKHLCNGDKITGRGSQWKKIRDEVVSAFPFCAVCGTTKNLQVHHITPYRITQDNGKENLVPLCVKHHKWVEMMFVETERFGFSRNTETVWKNMIRSRQAVTAANIVRMYRAAA